MNFWRNYFIVPNKLLEFADSRKTARIFRAVAGSLGLLIALVQVMAPLLASFAILAMIASMMGPFGPLFFVGFIVLAVLLAAGWSLSK